MVVDGGAANFSAVWADRLVGVGSRDLNISWRAFWARV